MALHNIMEDDKQDIEHVEKAYEVPHTYVDVHLEQDWTPEEESAVVYVLLHPEVVRA